MEPPHTISVIVPVLNEARRIAVQLGRLATNRDLDEIIVVDGGSDDGTLDEVARFPEVRALSARRGRAWQMNRGADGAAGDVLLFLHADVTLPARAATAIRSTLGCPRTVAGAFRTWTVPDRPTWLSPLLHLADLRSRLDRLPYGDQALFVRATTFRAVGGFPEIPIMEDLALSKRLRQAGRVAVVDASVRVSGRRFVANPIYYTLLVNTFPLLYRMGVSTRFLASLYGSPR